MLNEWGRIAYEQWLETESIRDNVILDTFVIMPNHVHGIVQITGSNRNTGVDNDGPYDVGACRNTPLQNDLSQQNRNTSLRNTPHHDHNSPTQNDNPIHKSEFRSPSKTLGAIVRGYKSAVTTRINKNKTTPARRYGSEIITIILFVINNHWNESGIILSTILSNGRTIEIIPEIFLNMC